jgi:hypothetical protein
MHIRERCTFEDPRPLEYAGPFDTMFGKSRSVGDSTDGKGGLGGNQVETTSAHAHQVNL